MVQNAWNSPVGASGLLARAQALLMVHNAAEAPNQRADQSLHQHADKNLLERRAPDGCQRAHLQGLPEKLAPRLAW